MKPKKNNHPSIFQCFIDICCKDSKFCGFLLEFSKNNMKNEIIFIAFCIFTEKRTQDDNSLFTDTKWVSQELQFTLCY